MKERRGCYRAFRLRHASDTLRPRWYFKKRNIALLDRNHAGLVARETEISRTLLGL
jgi:hypothetical protein